MKEDVFNERLTQFLFSPNDSRYRNNFKFSGDLICGEPAPPILVSSVKFTHPKLDTGYRGQHVDSMRWVKEQVKKVAFNTTAFPMAQAYSRWEIDEVISHELMRNVLMALAMVSVTTLISLGGSPLLPPGPLLSDYYSCRCHRSPILLGSHHRHRGWHQHYYLGWTMYRLLSPRGSFIPHRCVGIFNIK